jgi:NAD(P)-dependent dehydrogenase (short-subunit alcohol dehydrogenase family)
MELKDKVVVVTGAASGIGRALAQRFAAEGARAVVAADVNADGLAETARAAADIITTRRCDVSVEQDIIDLVEATTNDYGPIDLFCSNAGIAIGGGAEVPDAEWDRIWKINTMAHVWAARAVLPGMLARGEGYLLNTVSAAGLLTNIGAAPYSVTKHAALAFAEWVAVTHGDEGIKVSALCPQGVRTNMLANADGETLLGAGAIEPEDVAEAVVQGLKEERFLILPHPEVLDYFQRKANDYDRWLRGMRKLQARFRAALSR